MLRLPVTRAHADPCWFTFPLLLADAKRRPALTAHLDAHGIDWRPVLAGNIARQPAFRGRVESDGALPVADALFAGGLWLPVHPMITEEDMRYVAETVLAFFR